MAMPAVFLVVSGLLALSSCSAKPTKTFHFVNTGAEPRSITLQLIKEDGRRLGHVYALVPIPAEITKKSEALEAVQKAVLAKVPR